MEDKVNFLIVLDEPFWVLFYQKNCLFKSSGLWINQVAVMFTFATKEEVDMHWKTHL